MSKITEVYMNIDGEQVHLSMKQFCEMREKQPELRRLRFIPIDNRMYQATAKQYLDWEKDNSRRKYLKKLRAGFSTVSLYSDDAEVKPIVENLRDETVDIETEVITSFLYEALREAFAQLSTDEKALITALVIEGRSERDYSREIGIPQKTVSNRKIRALSKLKKLLKFEK